MHERTQDAMTYVRKFDRPTLFITMTCNPKWPEIAKELLPSQSSHHRPDLVARVFNLKKNELSKRLTKDCIFDKSVAYVCSIEWQKRGFPHAHILLWLTAEHKIRSELIDAAISANLPHSDVDSELHRIVTRRTVHDDMLTLLLPA